MKNNFYPITIEEHKEGGYYARCPVIQGAWADGETIEKAVENLKNILKAILWYRTLTVRPATLLQSSMIKQPDRLNRQVV